MQRGKAVYSPWKEDIILFKNQFVSEVITFASEEISK